MIVLCGQVTVNGMVIAELSTKIEMRLWTMEVHKKMMRFGIVVVTMAVAASACHTTKAWKRATLAKPIMLPDGDASREALRHHVLSTREGAVGGFGGGGGGCGCN